MFGLLLFLKPEVLWGEVFKCKEKLHNYEVYLLIHATYLAVY